MYNVRIIEYPNSYQVRLYSELLYEPEDMCIKINCITGEEIVRKRKVKDLEKWDNVFFEWEDIEDIYRDQKEDQLRWSMTRTKNMMYYIARSNVWDWFVTLTLSPDKIDRYDYAECSKKVRKWFDNLKRRKAPDMYYMIVPEMHKDGAWHFHGLIGGCTGLTFVDSGKKDDSGNQIYNFEDWKFGFSTATAVQDTERVSSYICKYITKDMCAATLNRQRYWVSRNCQRAPITKELVTYDRMKEYRIDLYERMSYKKKVQSEFMDVEYFEIPKEK